MAENEQFILTLGGILLTLLPGNCSMQIPGRISVQIISKDLIMIIFWSRFFVNEARHTLGDVGQ